MRLTLCSGFKTGIKFSLFATMSNARARCFQRENARNARIVWLSNYQGVQHGLFIMLQGGIFWTRFFLEKVFRFNIGFILQPTPQNDTHEVPVPDFDGCCCSESGS